MTLLLSKKRYYKLLSFSRVRIVLAARLKILLARMSAGLLAYRHRDSIVNFYRVNGFPKSAILKPYGSVDCLALHYAFQLALSAQGCKAKILGKQLSIDDYIVYHLRNLQPCADNGLTKRSSKYFIAFQKSLKDNCQAAGLATYYYPILDTIINCIPADCFFSDFCVDIKMILDRIKLAVDEACKLALAHDICILTDSAYCENNILKQEFIKRGKKVYILNPNGKLLLCTTLNQSEYSISVINQPYTYSQDNVDQYLCDRFAGKSRRDLDSARAFGASTGPTQFSTTMRRKVLFLHAFRDVNNLTWSSKQVFDSYYEWVNYTFKQISVKNDWNNWYVKAHPSADLYDSDRKILNQLLLLHNAPEDVLKCPSTKFIVDNKMPVFTNQGTIVLETLVHGYKSFFCGSLYPDSFGISPNSPEEWSHYICLSIEECTLLSSIIDIELVNRAKIALWRSFAFKNIGYLCPDKPSWPKDRLVDKVHTFLSQSRNALTTHPSSIELALVSS